MYSNRMKTTDDFLAEARFVRTGSVDDEFKALLNGLKGTKRAFQVGNPNKGYRSAVMSMWSVARVMGAGDIELPEGLPWETLQMSAKALERGVERDCMNEVEWVDNAIAEATFAKRLSQNSGGGLSKRALNALVGVLHALAGTLYGTDALKSAERIVDRVERVPRLRPPVPRKKM